LAEQTSVPASAAPPSNERPAQPTSTQTPPPATTPKVQAPAPASGQPTTQTPEEDRIRKMQQLLSQKDRQAQQEKAQLQQQMAAMQAQMTQLATQNMGEDEAQQFRTQQYVANLEARIAQQEAAAAMAQAQLQINGALYSISATTDIPFDDLQEKYEETRNADAVWAWATKQALSRLTSKERADGERNAAKLAAAQEAAEEAAAIANEPDVDLGSGRAKSEEDPLSAALKRNDSKAYVAALRNSRKKP
jgi:hypothetical protein